MTVDAGALLTQCLQLVEFKQWSSVRLLLDAFLPQIGLRHWDACAAVLVDQLPARLLLLQYAKALFHNSELTACLDWTGALIEACGDAPDLAADVLCVAARAHAALGAFREAAQSMSRIPADRWSVRRHMDTARFMRLAGDVRGALEHYEKALQQCPQLVEAAMAISELSEHAATVIQAVAAVEQPETRSFLTLMAQSSQHVRAMNYPAALSSIQQLNALAPLSALPQLLLARVHTFEGDFVRAEKEYDAFTRSQPSAVVIGTDLRAIGLLMQADNSALAGLVQFTARVAPRSNEAWLCNAAMQLMMGNSKAAQQTVESVLRFMGGAADGRTHPFMSTLMTGRLLRASCLLELSTLLATAAFRQVVTEFPSVLALHGIATSQLKAKRARDALSAAKIAVTAAPTSAMALVMFGKVLASTNSREPRQRAKTALRSALERQPHLTEAAVSLAQVLAEEDDILGALKVLKTQLAARQTPSLFFQLGFLFERLKLFDDAVNHYHTALSLNPEHAPSAQALQRVQQAMKAEQSGVDDDEAEEEEEEMDDDEEEADDDGGGDAEM